MVSVLPGYFVFVAATLAQDLGLVEAAGVVCGRAARTAVWTAVWIVITISVWTIAEISLIVAGWSVVASGSPPTRLSIAIYARATPRASAACPGETRLSNRVINAVNSPPRASSLLYLIDNKYRP